MCPSNFVIVLLGGIECKRTLLSLEEIMSCSATFMHMQFAGMTWEYAFKWYFIRDSVERPIYYSCIKKYIIVVHLLVDGV